MQRRAAAALFEARRRSDNVVALKDGLRRAQGPRRASRCRAPKRRPLRGTSKHWMAVHGQETLARLGEGARVPPVDAAGVQYGRTRQQAAPDWRSAPASRRGRSALGLLGVRRDLHRRNNRRADRGPLQSVPRGRARQDVRCRSAAATVRGGSSCACLRRGGPSALSPTGPRATISRSRSMTTGTSWSLAPEPRWLPRARGRRPAEVAQRRLPQEARPRTSLTLASGFSEVLSGEAPSGAPFVPGCPPMRHSTSSPIGS